MKFIYKLISTFEYHSLAELSASLYPSKKYGVTFLTLFISSLSGVIAQVFGLDELAFTSLMGVFIFELITGLYRAKIKKEKFVSIKLSRFSFKVCYYMVIISIAYSMKRSFEEQEQHLAASIFSWMHVFFVIQIVLENVVSITENIAVITGKSKEHFIAKLKTKINELLK